MPESPAALHLAVALDGAGWHPAAWREAGIRPAELFTAGYWAGLVQEAERGLLDFVTFEDGLGLQSDRYNAPDPRADRVRGRLDAVLIAARVAPVTRHIGLVPTAVVTHTEPFHLSKAIATLDYVSQGRAGVRLQVTARAHEAAHFGRRTMPVFRYSQRGDPEIARLLAGLMDEAADYAEVLRRLWDSWEDDAEIRDAATGRFVDRDKLHYIDFAGEHFRVKGPSITPRPPQGQPVIAALAHSAAPYQLVARAADVRGDQDAAGRAGQTLHVFGDLVVFLEETAGAAARRKARLDELAGEEYRSDALVFTGTPQELAGLLHDWQAAGLSGFRLRPGVISQDLAAITANLVPLLQERGAFRASYQDGTLRTRLGLPRPASRYAGRRSRAGRTPP
jgi:alkanesulfonate monooxygenase SsuD/methylene tetrahydromethanopterin reductase-like flavin-dependent oxidoreductase (luciferase family)